MRILIVGKGSIGIRHAKIFYELNCEVSFLRANKSTLGNKFKYKFKEYFKINEIKNFFFDLIIICNPTSLHVLTLKKLVKFSNNFFIEKPIAASSRDLKKLILLKKKFKLNIFSGFMMRQDPKIIYIKKKIINLKKKTRVTHFVWRTYLPDWHPYENYRNSYAFKKNLGGGVIRTCCHEIDMAIFLNGPIISVSTYRVRDNLNGKIEGSVIIILVHVNKSISNILLDFSSKIFERYFNLSIGQYLIKWIYNKNYIKINNRNYVKKINFKNCSVDNFYILQNKKILYKIKNLNKKKIKKQMSKEWRKILSTEHTIIKCLNSLQNFKQKIL